LGGFVERRVGEQLHAGKIPHRVLVLPDRHDRRVRHARERFERASEIALIHVRKDDSAYLQMNTLSFACWALVRWEAFQCRPGGARKQ